MPGSSVLYHMLYARLAVSMAPSSPSFTWIHSNGELSDLSSDKIRVCLCLIRIGDTTRLFQNL
jgi:hypothetical protein